MSNSLSMLIFFRVIQGIVAGPLIPAVAEPAFKQLPASKAVDCAGAVVNDGDCRANLRADPRRVYQ